MDHSRSDPGPAALAHVATLAFVAARAAPPVGFPLALAGGVALARAGSRLSVREAYGSALAAIIETVAIVGPSRLGGPLTQAATAPLLGRLHARGTPRVIQVAVCAVMRFTYNAATTAFFIWVLSGGLDAYAGTYDSIVGRIPGAPGGAAGALAVTAAVLLAWALASSTAQVLVYRGAIRRWPVPDVEPGEHRHPPPHARSHRFDPRAVGVASLIAFCLLLAGTDWALLAASAAWLAAAWIVAKPDHGVLRGAAAVALVLAASAFGVSFVGGEGLAGALAHGVRAALLVLVAAWLRGATGPRGFREVVRRLLARLRRVPAAPEASRVIEELGPERRLGAAARSLAAALRGRRRGLAGAVDAALGWIATEVSRFKAMPAAAELTLRLRSVDLALALSAWAPAVALAAR